MPAGLQSVPVRCISKCIQNLPLCPLGTRGRILCRRLAHSASPITITNAAMDEHRTATEPAVTSTSQFKNAPPSDEDIDRILGNRPYTAYKGDRVVTGIAAAAGMAIQDRLQKIPPEPLEKTPLGPLDPRITGLTFHVPSPRPSTIQHLLWALSRSDDSAIWHFFMKAHTEGILSKLRPSEFSAVLRSLRPENYVSIIRRHKLLDSGRAVLLSEDSAFAELKRKLLYVMWNMRWNGIRLTLSDYFHVLDCARAGGDVALAEETWDRLSGDDRVSADAWCYNSYMAAVCGTTRHERWIRPHRETLERRTRDEARNPRNRAFTLFHRMQRRGIAPNAMTFDVLMMAQARLRDVGGVKRTLARVWNVDANNLVEPPPPPTRGMTPDAPLYPSVHTLLAVAVAFGSNGLITTAAAVVDHMARRYNVPITTTTWIALLNWTYTHAHTRDADVPRVAVASVEELWKTMMDEYGVKPSLSMYDYYVRSLLWRQLPGKAEAAMDGALVALGRLMKQVYAAKRKLRKSIKDEKTSAWRISKLRNELAHELHELYRAKSIVRRWVEILVLGKGMEKITSWSREYVPRAVEKWGNFLGDEVVYFVKDGYVVLHRNDRDRQRWEPMIIRRKKTASLPLGTGSKEEDDFF